MIIRVSAALTLALGIALAAPPVAAGQTPPQVTRTAALTAEQWRLDLDHLVQSLTEMHPDAFSRVGRQAFDAQAAALRQEIPNLSREQILVRFMTLTASLVDGHTTVPSGPLRDLGAHVLPLRFYVYPEGLYVQAADRRYENLIGAEVVSIAGVPIAEVRRRVSAVVPRDNVHTVTGRLPAYMAVSEVLTGLGIAADPEAPISIQVRRDGRLVSMDVEPIPMPEYRAFPEAAVRYTSDWMDPGQAASPLWLRHTDKLYWMEYLPNQKTLFVQMNASANDPAEPVAEFSRRVRAEIDQRDIERVVLDLRLHPGGEGFLNDPLFMALARSPKLEQRGRLVVLTGQHSFSASVMFAAQLQRFMQTPFVGAPTAAGNLGFSNHRPVVLPSSGLTVMVSTVAHYFTGPDDRRDSFLPEAAADLTAADYAAGRDPVLEAALAYRPARETLQAAIDAAAPDAVGQAFRAWKAEPVNRYLVGEGTLNAIGYAYLRQGHMDRALAVFLAAVEAFPHSANAQDSLGEGYRQAGRTQEAIAAYRRALALNPAMESATRALAELGG